MGTKLEAGQPLTNFLMYGAIGGLVGGVFYALVLASLGMYGMIGAMLGAPGSTNVGVIGHFVASLIFGLAFGVLFFILVNQRQWNLDDTNKNVLLGLVYGFAVWVFGPVLVMPAWLGMPIGMPLQDIVSRGFALGFFGHLIFGVLVAFVTVYTSKMR